MILTPLWGWVTESNLDALERSLHSSTPYQKGAQVRRGAGPRYLPESYLSPYQKGAQVRRERRPSIPI